MKKEKIDDPLTVEYDALLAFESADEAARATWHTQNNVEKQMRWEERVVKRILTLSGHAGVIQDMKNSLYALTESTQLYFVNFLDIFPNFPLWINCSKIPFVFQTTFEDLYDVKKTKKSKIYKTFLTQLENVPDTWEGKPVGLVFEWLHSGGQIKVFHNHTNRVHKQGSRFEVEVLEGDKYVFYQIENFDDFLANVGWAKPREIHRSNEDG